MTSNNDDIFALRARAGERQQARDTLRENFAETKERVRPSNLVKEVKQKATDRAKRGGENAVQMVKDNPGIIASVAAATAAIVFRKPITNFVQNFRSSDQVSENSNGQEAEE